LLNVSDQADVKALVVHCSTSWSITPEEAKARVDRKEKKERRMARCSMYIGKRKRSRERDKERGEGRRGRREPRDSPFGFYVLVG